MGISDRADRCNQIVAAAGRRSVVLHGAGKRVGGGRPIGGHMIWHYRTPPSEGDHIGNRGLGMYKGWLYFMRPDGHLISLNAKDGTVRWDVQIADVTKGYWTTMAPLVVGNHVIVGVSGRFR